MTRARRGVYPLIFCLSVGTVLSLPRGVSAQQPIPAKFRDEAARVNGGSLQTGPAPAARAPLDPVADSVLRAERRAADSIAVTTPQTTPLMQGTVEIRRGTYQAKGFVVPASSRCALTGNSDAGDRDVEVLVLSSLEMAAWQADAQAGNPVWRSGLTKNATLNVSLARAGNYDLVISNRAAWLLTRTVNTRVQLVCVHNWPSS